MDYLGGETEDYPPPPPPPAPENNIQEQLQQHAHQPLDTHPVDPQTPISQPPLQTYTPSPYLVNPSDPYNGMPPPPQRTYPDLPTLMRACQEHGRAHGYACVTSSNNYKRGIAYVRCDRGGEYVNHWKVTPENRVRKNRTRRLVGCKWKARAKRVSEREDGEWQLTMMEDKHTGHGPSGDLSAHPSLRQLPEEAVEAAKGAFLEKKSPKHVLELLKGWNEFVTAQDVYNLKAKVARKNGGGSGRKRTALSGTPGMAARARVEVPGSDGDAIVDPALRAQDAHVGSFGQLTAAVAQMQSQSDEAMGEGHISAGGKCSCTCCDH